MTDTELKVTREGIAQVIKLSQHLPPCWEKEVALRELGTALVAVDAIRDGARTGAWRFPEGLDSPFQHALALGADAPEARPGKPLVAMSRS